MISNFYRSLLFLSSFMPLYLILIVKFYNFEEGIIVNFSERTVIHSILIGLIVLSILIFLYFLRCEMNAEESFGDIENVNIEILSYFIIYIVPLTTLQPNDINSIIINLILFFVIGVFYVNGNLFYLNIMFTLTGFNLYKDNTGVIIISRMSGDKINRKDFVKVKRVGNKICIINRKNP